MKRTWRKKIGAVVALLAAVAVLGTGCGADAAGAVESRTRETRALGLLLSREDTFLSELKADIEAEAAAQGYAVRYYNAGNDPETQLRQVHEALAEGVETLLVNLADGEDSEKVADIVGDAGVVLLNRAPGTAILNERMVFVGMDADGKPRYANQRGIGSNFIGDANGSDKHYSFGISAAAASDTLHLFESAVDLLSYGTLQKLDGKDWRGESLLSLAGVYKPRAKIEESSLPAALVRYLAEHPHIRRVVLRLDNDTTGRIAAETIKALLPRKYAVTVDIQPPPQGKDYNDCLCMRLGLPITKRGERSKER